MSLADFEDEAGKLRRNTLGLSVITIIFTFLGLTFPTTVFGFGVPPGSEQKMWVLIALVSLYMFARYYDSDEGSKYRGEFAQQVFNRLPRARCRLFSTLVVIHAIGLPVPTFVAQAVAQMRANLAASRVHLTSVQFSDYDPGTGLVRESLQVLYVNDADRDMQNQQRINVQYQPPRVIALLTSAYLSLFVAAERHVFVNILIPYVMFGVSAALLIVRAVDELLPALGAYVVFGMTI